MPVEEDVATTEDEERWLTTGEMARLSGTTLRTVRFYESEGLITSRAREDGTHRRFPPQELQKLQIISDLREAGLSLAEIRELMTLKRRCMTAEQAAGRMSGEVCAQLAEVDRRIRTLTRVRQQLQSMVQALEVCKDCTAPDFPERCRDCDVVNRGETMRTAHLLWKV